MPIVIKCECGTSYRVDDTYSGKCAKCKKCGHLLHIPVQQKVINHQAKSAKTVANDRSTCPICRSAICHGESITKCPDCNTIYHSECWAENGGCGIYGCSKVPETEQLSSIEIPISYWGQEDKPCPECNATILASAIRCRHCGATFQSACPEDTNEYRAHQVLEQQLPTLRKRIFLLFVFCIIPFTAPIATVIGIMWHFSHRKEIKAMPRLYPVISIMAICIGAGQTIFMVLATTLFGVWRT